MGSFRLVAVSYTHLDVYKRQRRNEGLGSDMLSRLEQQGRPLVAEAEFPVPGGSDAENALRLRRIQFYIRNGFTPAYIISLWKSRKLSKILTLLTFKF